jgi:hypothetical protein
MRYDITHEQRLGIAARNYKLKRVYETNKNEKHIESKLILTMEINSIFNIKEDISSCRLIERISFIDEFWIDDITTSRYNCPSSFSPKKGYNIVQIILIY